MTYEHLSVEAIPGYLASRPELASRVDVSRIANIEEVGDGNLNLVFIVHRTDGKGVVLKQSLPYVRLVGPEWPMTPDRARIEYETTLVHARCAPSMVPEMYLYDTERFIMVMEDLSDHRVWRGELNEGCRHEGVAASLGKYVASVAFGTSVFGLVAEKQQSELARAVNPELCRITEDLVFSEPYVNVGRNSVLPGNEKDAIELANNLDMVNEIGQLKWYFLTHGEALIHGDLHTGSVMVRNAEGQGEGSTKVIDSEFAFYGPVGFDLGALWANYIIAAARGLALGDEDHARWALGLFDQTWNSFEASFRELWPSRVDPGTFNEAVLERTIDQWGLDAAGFAAAKMARRIVGLAKASDIQTLDPSVREGAARGVLRVAQDFAIHRHIGYTPPFLSSRAGEILASVLTR